MLRPVAPRHALPRLPRLDDIAGAATVRRRKRLSPDVRRERLRAARDRWAEKVPTERRAEFDRLLAEADELIARGWQLRKSAWAIAHGATEASE